MDGSRRTSGLMGRRTGAGFNSTKWQFPILLAGRLRQEDALQNFDPYVLVKRAACYLVRHGPVTKQERWEDSSGYSPSTLAACIAALICAGCFCRKRGDTATAQFLAEYADFLESHIERWMATTEGSLLPSVRRHWIRLLPADPDDPSPNENPNTAAATIPNQPPGEVLRLPAKEIVDAGFLELVRYGVRSPDDPLIIDSLRVVDALLKVETSNGPCWRRYNHDGYGQREDGGPFVGWGQGRAWPLLTGERRTTNLPRGATSAGSFWRWNGSQRARACLPNRFGTSRTGARCICISAGPPPRPCR